MAYTYARRIELARQRGFTDPTGKVNPYTYYRRATEFASQSEQFVTATGDRAGIDPTGKAHELLNARLYYEAFHLGDQDDYSVHMRNGKPVVVYGPDGKPRGAKAVVLITILKYVPSAAAWRRLYPTKTRFGHLLERTNGEKRSRRK